MERLVRMVEKELDAYGFRSHQIPRMTGIGVIGFWRRCTWNTNRAVAVLRRPEGEGEIGPYCQQAKWKLLRCTRFIPFLYEVGLQIIVVGDWPETSPDNSEDLKKSVDKVNNQLVVLQSIFSVDEYSKGYVAARTWGQIVTGKFQDAIAGGIEAAGFHPVPSATQGTNSVRTT